jgi:macrolide-specific efflux system membrane fusion protein
MVMKRKTGILVAAGLLVAAFLLLWTRGRDNGRDFSARYSAVRAARTNIALTVQSTATVRPQNRLEIQPPLAGRVEEVRVAEGDRVEEGQVIAAMSSTDRAAVLDAARARGPAELARWEDIYRPTPIVAPLAGAIIARDVEPGQTVTLQDTLLVMSDVLIVEADVDETDLALIRTGQTCVVMLDAYPDRSFPARVSHIAYEAETVQNVTVYKVEVLPDQMPEFVRSGMTAGITFRADSTATVLAVPAEAVQEEDGRKVVWVPAAGKEGGRASRPVEVGLSDGRNVEVLRGLTEGESVLVPRIQAPVSSGREKRNPFMPFGQRRPPPRSAR